MPSAANTASVKAATVLGGAASSAARCSGRRQSRAQYIARPRATAVPSRESLGWASLDDAMGCKRPQLPRSGAGPAGWIRGHDDCAPPPASRRRLPAHVLQLPALPNQQLRATLAGELKNVSGGVAGRLAAHVLPLFLLVAFAPTVVGCSINKCGPSPKLLATWPGHTLAIYNCGGTFPPMTSTVGPADTAPPLPQIVLSVGQQLQIAEQGDWSGYQISSPLSDTPQVLRLETGASGKVVGTYTAVGAGFADVGAHIDLCGTATCFLTEVEVTR